MMHETHKYIAAIVLAGLQFVVQAQVTDSQSLMEAILESVTEDMGEESDAAIILEDLEGFALNPLNINTTTHDQLSRLHLLDDIQIAKLLEYREAYGQVFSIYELNAIDGLNPEILMKMEPFIRFGPVEEKPRKISDVLNYGRHEVLLRSIGTIQKPEGYKERDDGSVPYEGNRFRYYSRYKFQSGDDITAGITAEKDQGEAFFKDSNTNGFDFYSANLSFKVNPFIQNVTLGDFVVRSGQGLVIWQGFSMIKSLYSLNIFKTNQGIRPYSSADENQFFRGVATTLGMGKTKLSFFFSKKNSDGNVAFSDSAGNYFTSLQTSGYHRTINEISDKNKVGDLNAGILGSRWFRNLKLGTVFLYRKFDLPFMPADQLFNQYNFRGTENYTAGADYLFSKGKYQLFGEAAVSKSGGLASLQGITAHLHDCLQMSALFRYFDKNYHALWSAPFAENATAANETGLYLGTRILPAKFFSLSAYSDFYNSGWIKYTTSGPTSGWDVFTQADFVPSERFRIYFRYKNEEKERKFRINKKNEDHPEQLKKSRLHLQ